MPRRTHPGRVRARGRHVPVEYREDEPTTYEGVARRLVLAGVRPPTILDRPNAVPLSARRGGGS